MVRTNVTPLPPPHHHRIHAAEGWLELGLPDEARVELEQIPQALQSEPAVLQARFALCAHRQDWQAAYELADRHVHSHPEDAGAWIHRAYAARRRSGGGLAEAFALLHPAVERFPQESVIPYNLACYCAQQAELKQAWQWLEKAAQVGGFELIRRMALADADLRPLWPRITDLE